MEGHNWVLNRFVWIPRRSIIVCFFSLLAKAGLNRTLTEYEGQTFFPVVGIGSPHPLIRKEVLLLPLWVQEGDTLAWGGGVRTQFRRRLTFMAGQDLTDFQGWKAEKIYLIHLEYFFAYMVYVVSKDIFNRKSLKCSCLGLGVVNLSEQLFK
jgi:hypothetical protein